MNEPALPFLSVIIPSRNEAGHIGACLESIRHADYPGECLEIIVVDGFSEDATAQIVLDLAVHDPRILLLRNPRRTVPHAMNIGIRAARGDVIMRMDAHVRYGANYLRSLVTWMQRLQADNVGAILRTRPANASPTARAIVVVMSHPFGVGNSQFRVVRSGQPLEVDTVPFGCYRRETFDRIGLYDERFVRNQDDELNARLKKAGGRIFLIPDVQVEYFARDSLSKLALMMYQYGYFKPLVAMKLRRLSTWRQLAPLMLLQAIVLPLLLSVIVPEAAWLSAGVLLAYSTVNVAVCAVEARKDGAALFLPLLAAFMLAHMAYGIGYLRGLVGFGMLGRDWKENGGDVSPSR